MGSKTFDGVWFIAYTKDHLPPHVHGFYAETELLLDLLPDGGIGRSGRTESVVPSNAPRSDIRKIVKVAAQHSRELHELWEKANESNA